MTARTDTEQRIELLAHDGCDPGPCIVDDRALLAVRAAAAVGRPLLVRGEPGIGKTLLGRVAAHVLERPLVTWALDARTELSDLFWTYDAVRRLAEAQVAAVTHKDGDLEALRQQLDVMNFVRPGPLWWAFAWSSALGVVKRGATHAGEVAGDSAADATDTAWRADVPSTPPDWKPEAAGVVVLLDEVDKADDSVPNGLLDVLDRGRFLRPDGRYEPRSGAPPLVIFTTNEERDLPPAFERRCFVLDLQPPESELRSWVERRARVHFPEGTFSDDTWTLVLDQLMKHRAAAPEPGQRPPCLAELVDLMRALRSERSSGSGETPRLDELASITLLKPRRRRV